MGRHAGVRWDGKAWVAEVGELYESNGRRRRRKVAFRFGKHERARALAEMLACREEQLRVEADPTAGYTVGSVLESWLAWSESHRAPKTYSGHLGLARLFLAHTLPDGRTIRDLPARELDAGHLAAAMDAMEAEGQSPAYRSFVCRGIRAAWNWAYRLDRNRTPGRLIPANTLAECRPPKVPRSPERYATRAEAESFLRFAYRRARALAGVDARGPMLSRFERLTVLLMRFVRIAGCRPDEAARATWDGVNLDRGTITLRGKTTHRTGQDRVVFLTPSLRRMLRAIRAMPGRHPVYVFSHSLGKYDPARGDVDRVAGVPWRGSQLQAKVCEIRREMIAAGVPIRDRGEVVPGAKILDEGPNRFVLYRLRHTRISDDLMTGASITEVATIHNTSEQVIRTTYGHLLVDHLARLNDDLVERARGRK